MEGATVEISAGFVSGEDVLAFSDANGITGSWDSNTGVLTLSGTSSIANYKAALESITYDNTNDNNPNTSNRTITWTVNDGDNNSASATSTITVSGSNDAPTGADAGATLAFTEGNGASVIDSSLTLADVDDTNLESATIQITSGYQSGEDVLAFTDQSGITGSWNSSTGTLSLSGSATKAQYETALESITYNNTSDTPDTTNRTVTWIVNDGDTGSTGITSTITVAAANDAPALAGGGNVLQFSEGDSAIVVNNALTLSDAESTVVNRVEVVLAGSGSGEQLNFSDTSKIEGSWSSGTLTLSAISGQSPTNAEFQAAIRTITYSNSDTSTADGNRTATFTAYEGSGTSLASSTAVTTISVATLDDDAPTLGGLSGSAVAYTESACGNAAGIRPDGC